MVKRNKNKNKTRKLVGDEVEKAEENDGELDDVSDLLNTESKSSTETNSIIDKNVNFENDSKTNIDEEVTDANKADGAISPQPETTVTDDSQNEISSSYSMNNEDDIKDISNEASENMDVDTERIEESPGEKRLKKKLETLDNSSSEINERFENEESKGKEITVQEVKDTPEKNLSTGLDVSVQEIVESPQKAETEKSTVEDGEWTADNILENFMEWSHNKGITLSPKVVVKCEGTAHRYGMIATEDIKKGETLFVVPRALCFNPDNSRIVGELVDYEDWLDSIGQSLCDSSGWATLLIVLMLEYHDKHSFWAPYLRLMPKPEEFGHPLFWSREEQVKELQGTTLLYDIHRDIYNIESEYKMFVLPFMYRYKDICGSIEKYSLSLYKRLVAFVMSYSFTEDFDAQPSMVPMADLLNHSCNNNAHLIYEEENLKMISLCKIDKGDEIFNTFGKLGNAELLQMYGYTDATPNAYDTLPILVNTFFHTMEKSEKVSDCYFQAMVSLLDKTEIAPADEYFLFDRNGMRKGPDLVQMLKILFMSEIEFEDMLKSRAANRPDSYYRKLLRKLNLAKKTDTSSGVAIIDITDEDADTEIPEKRKFVDLQEIEDNDEPDSKRMYNPIVKPSLFSTSGQPFPYDGHDLQKDVRSDSVVGGNSASDAIVIDDDDFDDDAKILDKKDDDTDKTQDGTTDISPTRLSMDLSKADAAGSHCDDNHNNSDAEELDDKKSESCVKDLKEGKNTEDESGNKSTSEKLNHVKESDEEKITKSSQSKESSDNKNESADTENVSNNETDSIKDMKESKLGDVVVDEVSGDVLDNKVNGELSDDVVSIGDEIEDDLDGSDSLNSDADEIQFLSEDIRCKTTYENLNKELKQEWKDFVRSVLRFQLDSLKADEEMTVEQARDTMTSRQFYAYQMRQGQRSIISTFLSSLT